MIQYMGDIDIPATNMADKDKIASFDFSASTFSPSKPNFKATNIYATRTTYYYASIGVFYTESKLRTTENFKKYFSNLIGVDNTVVNNVGYNLTFSLLLYPKECYALSSEVAHLTSDGLSIQLTLQCLFNQCWLKR